MSIAIVLALIPITHALPSWLQPRRDPGVELNIGPRQYTVYDSTSYEGYGGYTWGGYGPQPTISISPSTSADASGEETSASSIAQGQSNFLASWALKY